MSSLGIYFGPKSIGIVESNGKKIVNNIQLDRAMTLGSSIESMEKVPDEVKLVALLKDNLRKYRIAAKEATITLSGTDLIVRTFDMPLLSADELASSISFEAKKYVPFKTEDMISDYQVRSDKANRKNQVVFVGIKKDVLSKYMGILRQAGITAVGVEYSSFSALRAGKVINIGTKTPIAVITVGAVHEGEVSFTVFDREFPLLTRDVGLAVAASEGGTVTGGAAVAVPAEASESVGMTVEKLKTELRISFDFYSRKFPGRPLASVCMFADESLRGEMESFAREMGISLVWMDSPKIPGYAGAFSASLVASYGASLAKSLKLPITINLAAPKVAAVKKLDTKIEVSGLLSGFSIDPKMVVIGVLICAATAGFGYYSLVPVKKALQETIAKRPVVETVDGNAPYAELNKKQAEYATRLKTLDSLVKTQLMVTTPLNVIPRSIPDGVWLTRFYFSGEQKSKTLTLVGAAYLADYEKEMSGVNEFVSNLRQDPLFVKSYPSIKIVSVSQNTILNVKATVFELSCGPAKESD